MTADINHPRALLPMWRGEADRMREHAVNAKAQALEAGVWKVFEASAATLDQCAGELERRLTWSGMLDP